MTQKTTTLAEKLESIKAALKVLSIQNLTHEMDEEQRECADYKLAYDALITKSREALATLQELVTEMAEKVVPNTRTLVLDYITLLYTYQNNIARTLGIFEDTDYKDDKIKVAKRRIKQCKERGLLDKLRVEVDKQLERQSISRQVTPTAKRNNNDMDR